MNSIIIENFDYDLIVRLKKWVEYSGCFFEVEVKEIFCVVLIESEENFLYFVDKIKECFFYFGDIEILIIFRDFLWEIFNFEDWYDCILY